ncbi:MAG: hypothetical protein K2I30_01550 [Clostridia bacterium]|nr:hypothetical protein [Clostridia bacterium]
MGIFNAIAHFFTFWITAANRYNRLKANDEKREKSVSLGVRSILTGIFTGVVTLLCVWGLHACIGFLNDGSLGFIIVLILTICLAAVLLAALVQGFIGSLLYLVYQFKLNKRAVRWVALAVWLAVLIAVIAVTLVIFLN